MSNNVSTNNQGAAKSHFHGGKNRKRWIVRGFAIVVGIIAGIDLVITVLPEPAPPQMRISGGIVSTTSYSSTDDSIVDAKNRVQSYLNPIGWVALYKGYGPKNLYILKRNENWKSALETGQVLTLLVLLVLPFALWLVSSIAGKRLLGDGKNRGAGL